jgi:exopolyphosphatase/guanosine-5'-triphosphate,3'-diphosphate pyrophosphatase
MAKCLAEGLPRPGVVVGVGGTLTTLLAMAEGARKSGSVASSSGEVEIEELRGLIKLVQGTPMGDRTRLPGLPTDRVDVILPGLIVVERLLTRLGAASVLVSEVGLREGLVLRTLRERERGGEDGGASVSTVRQFAVGCGYDVAHSEHVAKLALMLFDQLVGLPEAVAKGFGERERERRLLEAAAVVHDVGVAVEYRSHHKHSYAMIANAELAGWSREDQELVALIARYHRKAQPSKRHPELMRLDKGARRLVGRLSGILRVADGLDRSHTQQVRRVEVTLHGKRLLVSLDSATDAREDVKGSRAKAELLEEVLGCSVRYAKWQAGAGADAAEAEPPAKTPRPRRKAIRAR